MFESIKEHCCAKFVLNTLGSRRMISRGFWTKRRENFCAKKRERERERERERRARRIMLTMKIRFLTQIKTDVLHQMTCTILQLSLRQVFDDVSKKLISCKTSWNIAEKFMSFIIFRGVFFISKICFRFVRI